METKAQLYKNIAEKLEFEPSLDSSHITIAINNGIITLGGTVSSLSEKRIAERAVESVAGVRAVANEIQVKIDSKLQWTDQDIAKAAVNMLEWDTLVPHEHIQVAVDDGHVKLTGTVEWWFQREAAEKAVRRLSSIKSIINQIVIKPKVIPRDVKTQIIREFHRNAQVDAEKIQVEVEGSKVILKGSVRSWPELQEAIHGAWSAPGVTNVESRLVIT